MPTTVLVHVLFGQGLGSRRLWAQIVALGRHPLPRYAPQIAFQPEGRARRVSVQTLISGTDDLWLGTGPGLTGGAAALYADCVAGLRSVAALGATHRHPSGPKGASLDAPPQP